MYEELRKVKNLKKGEKHSYYFGFLAMAGFAASELGRQVLFLAEMEKIHIYQRKIEAGYFEYIAEGR